MKIDFDKLAGVEGEQEQIDAIKEQIENADYGDQPFLSDILARADGLKIAAMHAIDEVCAEEYKEKKPLRLWRIRILNREWKGDKVKPGDKIYFRYDKNRAARDGKPTPTGAINLSKIDGSYEKKYEGRREYEIDGKGCIECEFGDAVNFLRDYGVHSVTGYALPHGKPEFSMEPCQDPKDGKHKLLQYWRYSEITPEQYDALPEIDDDKVIPELNLSGDSKKSRKGGRDNG